MDMNSIAACSRLLLATTLSKILCSPEPPMIDFFLTLPQPPPEKVWGIYAIVLEETSSKTMLYISSGTDTVNGAVSRFNTYNIPDTTKVLLRFVD